MSRQGTTTPGTSTPVTSTTATPSTTSTTTSAAEPSAKKIKPAKPVVVQKAKESAPQVTPEERTANYIAVCTLLLLQNLLQQERVNPLTDFLHIVALADNIAALNSSIKPI